MFILVSIQWIKTIFIVLSALIWPGGWDNVLQFKHESLFEKTKVEHHSQLKECSCHVNCEPTILEIIVLVYDRWQVVKLQDLTKDSYGQVQGTIVWVNFKLPKF